MDEQVSPPETRPAPPAPAYEPGPAGAPSPRRRRGGVLPWIVLVLVVAAVVWWHPWHRATGPAKRAAASQAVGIASAVSGDMPVTLTGLGTVTPVATVTVQTQLNGILTAVGYKQGQEVKKGDFLAQIDPRPYEAQLEQYQGAKQRDEALLGQARTDLARYETLARQNSIAAQQVADQRFLAAQYQGDIRTDQAQIDTANIDIGWAHITAPVSGRVGLRLVDPGNYVTTASTTGIVVITQTQPTTVIFTVPQSDIPEIRRAMAAGPLAVTASDSADTKAIATGTLEVIDNQIDTTTGTVKLRANFPNADEALFPNQFVNATLLVDTLHSATLVPTAAVQQGAPGNFVFVVNADDTVNMRKVTLGPAAAGRTAITAGLKPGERVVTDGTDRLRDGEKVSIPAEQKSGAAPAAAPGRHRRRDG